MAEVHSVAALTSCPKLKALSRTGIGDESIKVWANSPSFAALEQLDLDSCTIDVEGVQALLASPYLSRTLDLSVDAAGLPESTVRALRARFVFQ